MPTEAEDALEFRACRHRSEAELISAARSGSSLARARLVESFMPLIGGVARIYRQAPGVERSELVQEGVAGLLRALERYDAELGTPFWAYASWWVRQAMQQLVAELSRPVVLSDRALRQLAQIREARGVFVRVHARDPSLKELAAAARLTVDQLQKLSATDMRPRGLDEPLCENSEDATTFGERLSDPRAEEAYEDRATAFDASLIPSLLACTSERERAVLEAHYGFGGRTQTLREVGQTLGVSAERVRQIEEAALEKMRAVAGLDRMEDVARKATGDAKARALHPKQLNQAGTIRLGRRPAGPPASLARRSERDTSSKPHGTARRRASAPPGARRGRAAAATGPT